MIQFENAVAIRCTPQRLFDYIADLEHTPEWNWAVDRTVKVTDGPIREGSVYVQERSTPRKMTENLRIVQLDPPSHLRVEGTLAGLPASLDYRLAHEGSRTILSNRVELEPRGMLRLIRPLARRQIRESVAANLEELKGIVEGSGSP